MVLLLALLPMPLSVTNAAFPSAPAFGLSISNSRVSNVCVPGPGYARRLDWMRERGQAGERLWVVALVVLEAAAAASPVGVLDPNLSIAFLRPETHEYAGAERRAEFVNLNFCTLNVVSVTLPPRIPSPCHARVEVTRFERSVA